jgi:hypothetical protein
VSSSAREGGGGAEVGVNLVRSSERNGLGGNAGSPYGGLPAWGGVRGGADQPVHTLRVLEQLGLSVRFLPKAGRQILDQFESH